MTDLSPAGGAPGPTPDPSPGMGYGPGYGTPTYGTPTYGPAGYGAPAGWPAPPSSRTDPYAIAALLFGLLPLTPYFGIVLGAIALHRIRISGARGRGLAIAGIVAGALWLLVFLVAVVVAVATSDVSRDGPAGARLVDVSTLRTGDCLGETAFDEEINDVPLWPCTSPHDAEVFAVGDLPDGPWPGQDQLYVLAEDYCLSQFTGYIGLSYEESVFTFSTLSPLEQGWEDSGDRAVYCVIDGLAGETGSVRDSRR